MGPRRRCRGRLQEPIAPARWPRRFNGATTKVSWKTRRIADALTVHGIGLQWGHDEGVVEDAEKPAGRPRELHTLQWGHDEVSWKTSRPTADMLERCIASMGPRRRCRGRRRRSRPSIADDDGASMGPRRRCRGRRTRADGHAEVAAASMGPRRRCRGRRAIARSRLASLMHASMGPRRRCRGRRLGSDRFRASTSGFNGATTKVSWKTVRPAHRSRDAIELQWGHDEGVVEDAAVTRSRIAAGTTLQWGHDEGVVEDWRHRRLS